MIVSEISKQNTVSKIPIPAPKKILMFLIIFKRLDNIKSWFQSEIELANSPSGTKKFEGAGIFRGQKMSVISENTSTKEWGEA